MLDELEYGRIALIFDNIDRLLNFDYSDRFFAMLRNWHQNVSSSNNLHWGKLALVLTTSTPTARLIRERRISPFNVAHEIRLASFTRTELRELNARYRRVLNQLQLNEFAVLSEGQRYVAQQGFATLFAGMSWGELVASASSAEGPFGAFLNELLHLVEEQRLLDALGRASAGAALAEDEFQALRDLGLLGGEAAQPQFANRIYQDFVRTQLLFSPSAPQNSATAGNPEESAESSPSELRPELIGYFTVGGRCVATRRPMWSVLPIASCCGQRCWFGEYCINFRAALYG
ncbi:hypothetical protein HC891_25215 [Candidatus Gracilibacteria bacterium]|nr:hypothetical protein [Candidatus Gracilibacteria bacterium]